ncbi:DUF2309 domain-containing protein [Novosphingobium piscinae]|uniref:Probable inorganic carbon transporter subunit DabA n=1 Tax=Novosphingobium piscinae TaxID=1507448 RepID=A0A7X1FZG5_9SPHN|nr:DUF2309 domain-containing protein [Novosphingobium piscinae]MBC2669684.1 DUF2309 domain-containing protein [Novosphingobium piscinae]
MNMMAALTVPDVVLTRTETAGLVALAARSVPPLWPLESAIAVNPLAGFEDLPFAEAVQQAAQRFGARESLPLTAWRQLYAAGRIDPRMLRDVAIRALGGSYPAHAVVTPGVTALDLLIARLTVLDPQQAEVEREALTPEVAFLAKWCAAFFDQGQAASPMPHRELGLYRAVLALAGHDPDYARLTGTAGAQLLLTVSRDPLTAIAEGLAALGVPEGGEVGHLAGLVARLPGWAGHIRWRAEHTDPANVAAAPGTMADLLALWLLLERAGALTPRPVAADPATAAVPALAAHFGWDAATRDAALASASGIVRQVAGYSDDRLGGLFMTAAEWTYRNTLVPQLETAAARLDVAGAAVEARPDAQLVFCIDVRSEPFRRALEAQGSYETFGYAGFFGLPIALHRHGEERRKRFLPVLLAPQHDVAEAPVPGQEAAAASLSEGLVRDRGTAALFGAAKQGTATAFATAEATGPLAGLLMAARTVGPRALQRVSRALAPERSAVLAPTLDRHPGDCARPAFTLEDKIGYASALFRLTGLKPQTARLLVLAGHGGSAVNNPYAAALDCGACGGHKGGANARILAAMLNEPAVREGLAAQGLVLPADTVVLAAEHDTTTDTVVLFDRDRVPASHAADLAALEAALERAAAANRARRAPLLGRSPEDLLTGAVHWGEVRPEWGLAGNAAFLVGPRAWTSGIDLAGRAFLHSYDWTADADGTALTTILTAPMVVAQWINCQYLFSTVDNHRYGSGDKVTQNVLGGIGVIQGNGGDLRIGLPRQSLFTDAGEAYHVPQRLLTVVHAPLARVEAVITANEILGRLFGNGWVQLVVIDPETGRTRCWQPRAEPDAEGTDPQDLTLA